MRGLTHLTLNATSNHAPKLSGTSVGFKLKQESFARNVKFAIYFTVLSSNFGFNSNSNPLNRTSVGPPE